ncbi:MAG: MBL fold metallo-hydrolase [Planctomycetales bacterium]|nr:MBL fold metallo-hydrolase [Planctomycetales bacterium]
MIAAKRAIVAWIGYGFLLLLASVAHAAPEDTYVKELAPGVFFRKAQTAPTFTGCNQGFVVFKNFVLVIDANFPGQADEVIPLIAKHTDKPIRYVFDTHHHGDHADGNVKYVEIGAAAVASERSRVMFETKGIEGFEGAKKTRLDEYGSLQYEQPSMYFSKRLVLDDGTQRLELLHFGHAHTIGDAVAWLPQHGILFTGDAVVNGAFNYTGDSNTESWITVINALKELPVKTVCPGHGEMGGSEVLDHQQRYFVELRARIRDYISQGWSLDKIKTDIELPFYQEWTGVDVKTRDENITHVFQELTAKK